tara:strand:- start:274 stop:432 length:159 start_codon:yes stop_codon:yes gene_type:complete
MDNHKLVLTTDILAPRIKHLMSENKALKNKVKKLENEILGYKNYINQIREGI